MNSKSSDIQSRLEQLHRDYARQLPEKITTIEQSWQDMLQRPDPASLQHLIRLCHTLAGSGASYGFVQVTEYCRQLEQQLRALEENKAQLDENFAQQIEQILEQLKTAIQHQEPNPVDKPDSPVQESPVTNHLVYIFDRTDHAISEQAGQMRNYGYTIEMFDDSAILAQQLQQQTPAALILSLSLRDGNIQQLDQVAHLTRQVPTLLLTDCDNTLSRLQAVRYGIDAYLLQPVHTMELIDILDRYSRDINPEPCRILIVEDSESTAEFYTSHLQAAGMLAHYITDPMHITEAIDSFSPELILLDIYMPGCNGKELSELIRQKNSNLSIPIVFLSSETDLDKQLSVIRHGDGFLTKPIQPEHLIAAIHSRANRFRTLRALMLHDSLTNLYNHTALIDILSRELHRARRHGDTLSYIMLDIDHFKAVNDNYGHDVGDTVIKSLSRLLRQRLRSSDSIGRYGGEEFAIIMPNTCAEDAFYVIEQIRRDFANLQHLTTTTPIFSTFSAGLADSQMSANPANLTKLADTALYRAKKAGRNQILLADPQAN